MLHDLISAKLNLHLKFVRIWGCDLNFKFGLHSIVENRGFGWFLKGKSSENSDFVFVIFVFLTVRDRKLDPWMIHIKHFSQHGEKFRNFLSPKFSKRKKIMSCKLWTNIIANSLSILNQNRLHNQNFLPYLILSRTI